MERWELIICLSTHVWCSDYVEVVTGVDTEQDVFDSYIEEYNKKMEAGDPDIVHIGVLYTENIEDEEF